MSYRSAQKFYSEYSAKSGLNYIEECSELEISPETEILVSDHAYWKMPVS